MNKGISFAEYIITDLNETQEEEIGNRLEEYNLEHIKHSIPGSVKIDSVIGERLVAGLIGYMTAYRILYAIAVFIDEDYRHLK